jgi:hypothetical protein
MGSADESLDVPEGWMFEAFAAHNLAVAFNTMDTTPIRNLLADDVRHKSQKNLEAIRERKKVLAFLQRGFDAIRENSGGYSTLPNWAAIRAGTKGKRPARYNGSRWILCSMSDGLLTDPGSRSRGPAPPSGASNHSLRR